MAYILGLVVVALLFLSMHYFTELTKSQKVTVSAFVLVIILGAIAFNSYSTSQRENMLNVVFDEQGELINEKNNIVCS